MNQKLNQEIFDDYYHFIEQETTCKQLLKHFNLDPDKGHIINGHVPVKIKEGEKPVKASGRLLMIDGGISKAYQAKTGSAGYTLIFDSQHYQLAKHLPFNTQAKEGLLCLTPEVEIIETSKRIKNRDCDLGKELRLKINDLNTLLQAYRQGLLKEIF